MGRNKIRHQCWVCKSIFFEYVSLKRKYCSRACYDKKQKIHPNSGAYKKGHLGFVGVYNYQWQGEKVGYHALHNWVGKWLGKPKTCTLCNSARFVQWANKSHKYERNLNDWVALCRKCHFRYDKQNFGRI